jgi:hypothetical protein
MKQCTLPFSGGFRLGKYGPGLFGPGRVSIQFSRWMMLLFVSSARRIVSLIDSLISKLIRSLTRQVTSLDHTCYQVMGRTAPLSVVSLVMYGILYCQLDFRMSISQLPVQTLRLNLVLFPALQTMTQSGPVILLLPKMAMDIPTFLRKINSLGPRYFS